MSEEKRGMQRARYASFNFPSGHKNDLETIAEAVEKSLHGLGLSIEVKARQVEHGGKKKIEFEFFQGSDRVCYECGKKVKKSEPDACLGNLPGVKNACCGHGDPARSYVHFTNGIILRGFNKIEHRVEEN
jgi:hypothetical protein